MVDDFWAIKESVVVEAAREALDAQCLVLTPQVDHVSNEAKNFIVLGEVLEGCEKVSAPDYKETRKVLWTYLVVFWLPREERLEPKALSLLHTLQWELLNTFVAFLSVEEVLKLPFLKEVDAVRSIVRDDLSWLDKYLTNYWDAVYTELDRKVVRENRWFC